MKIRNLNLGQAAKPPHPISPALIADKISKILLVGSRGI